MNIKNRLKFGSGLFFLFLACGVLILSSSHAFATVPYISERINLMPGGGQMTSGNTQIPPILSQDGRYVAFSTSSSQIVSGDTNNNPDVFVRDRKLGTTVRATLSNSGNELLSSFATNYKMSGNGRFIIFEYSGGDAVTGDTNNKKDVFLRDLKNNTTEMVSLTSTGGLPNDASGIGDVSADGRFVVFYSLATNLVPGDTNGVRDIFIRDRKLGTTSLLSQTSGGVLGNNVSSSPSISCDGSYVTFMSGATNLVPGDTNGKQDLFLVDRTANNAISNITINGNDTTGDNNYGADISCNGETIVFYSSASNLVGGDTNNAPDIFAYNLIDGTFERVNVDSSGNQTVWATNPANGVHFDGTNNIDFSGRYVVFEANTNTLVSGDTNNSTDVFLRDLKEGTTQIISKRNTSTQTNDTSQSPSISLDGRSVTFTSWDAGLVSGDTNGIPDFFVSQTGI